MRVLALMHEGNLPPDDLTGYDDKQIIEWKTEYDVRAALEHLGHEVKMLGLGDDLTPLREQLREWRPHVAFNLLEEFGGKGEYVPFILGYLELQGFPFTGCNPRGLLVADDKVLTKKLLKHHRIRMPEFAVFPMGRAVRPPRRLRYPLIVKSATEHGSVGISQASVVYEDEKLAERVQFVHETIQTAAIAEEYIEGREVYVGVVGNRRLQTLPPWELTFKNLSEGAPRIATSRIKWDPKYQQEIGISSRRAKNVPDAMSSALDKICKRVFRILNLTGCARMDLRITEDGRIYLLEPNPNPDLAHDEDFALSADSAGLKYEALIQKLVTLGRRYHVERTRGE